MDKRADIKNVLAILLIVVAVVVLCFLLILPLRSYFQRGVDSTFEMGCEVVPGLGTCKSGYFISVFSYERALDGALKLSYSFIKPNSGTSAMSSYSIKEKEPADGSGSAGSAEKEIRRGGIDDTFYLVDMVNDSAGNEKLAALAPQTYIIYALGEDGSMLESLKTDYKGAFPLIYQSDKTRYDMSIASFVELATQLKTASAGFSTNLILHKDLMMVSFNRDFNEGKGSYKSYPFLSCPGNDIAAPKECGAAKSCLCLCLKEDIQKNKACDGRLCYGYELGFLGGTQKNCWADRIFTPKGKDGEDNQEVTLYLGESFKDPDHEFNSLAIENAGDSISIPLSINLDSRSLKGDTLNRAIISMR